MFQIFAQLIELRPAPLPAMYMAIFPPLLAPLFWERHGNVPALVRLLRAYMAKAAAEIVAQGHLQVRAAPVIVEGYVAEVLPGYMGYQCGRAQAVLGVFQKLVASKAHDQEGFRLLGAVATHVPLPALSPFLPTVRALHFALVHGSRGPVCWACR